MADLEARADVAIGDADTSADGVGHVLLLTDGVCVGLDVGRLKRSGAS